MRFYEIPDVITKELEQFDADIKDYVHGVINPIKFRAIRVAHGVYEQRQEHTYMIRIRCAAGGITPSQLQRVADVGAKYGSGEVHFTTRSEVQVHNVLIADVSNVINELLEVGLSTRGGGGNTIRNILTSPDSGVSKDDVFDVDPYAIALTTRMIHEPDSWNLPRKFKIAMSNSAADTAFTQATCLGFVATLKDGQKGFKVYCAGGMGAKPMVGNLLFDFIPDTKVYHVTRALKTMFDKHGNRRSKFSSRLKFLWKKLQREDFIHLFRQEYDQIKDDESLNLELIELDNEIKQTTLPVEEPTDSSFEAWKSRYCVPQKQTGLVSIKIPLVLGDLLSTDATVLCELLQHFGENTIRCDRAQNIRLRNIPETHLVNAYNVLKTMKKTLVEQAPFIGNMINCTGAQTCKLGICLPRGLSDAIRERLINSSLDLDRLTDFRLNMSGCPNTCGMHHIAHLGFFGKVSRKEGVLYPAYYVLAGSRVSAGKTEYAHKVSEIAAHHIPDFVHDFLEAYLVNMDEYKDYYEYLEDEGEALIKRLCEGYKENVPEFDKKPEFFVDFGAKRPLSLDEMGSAECSAGMFDMIDVDKKLIKSYLKTVDEPTDEVSVDKALYKVLFSASRMLLVTRGLETKTDDQVFSLFNKHFVETDLVDKSFNDVVKLGERIATDEAANTDLFAHKDKIVELADAITALYKSMDDSLRFKVKAKETPEKSSQVTEKDFRGVGCPMNFVKTKLVLDTLKSGDKLRIFLDDGEPIENVPNSVKLEGHAILEQTQVASYWSVLIQKK